MFSRLSFRVRNALLLIGLTLSATALAKDDHDHPKGPNGGEVKSLGDKLHVEAVRKGTKVSVIVLDGDGKNGATLSKHGGGSLSIVAAGAAAQKIDLPAGKDLSTVEATVPEKGKVTALLSLKIDGKAVTAKFVMK